MNIRCGHDYIGHRWSIWQYAGSYAHGDGYCKRCHEKYPHRGILNGLPIPERLVVQADIHSEKPNE